MLQVDKALRTTAVDGRSVRNRLLETMPPEDFEVLRNSLEPIELRKGAVIQDANRPIEHTYFIESGVVSIVARTNLDGSVEILTCGYDGLVGIATLLDGGPSVHRACVQVAGSALRISTADFASAMSRRPSIREHLMSYLRILILKQQHTALCNARHDTEQKVARWLLLAQDYAETDVLSITHDLLSGLLNARRAGVTQVLAGFEADGIVARSRGALRIRNRALLQSRSCNCYKAIAGSVAWLDERAMFCHPMPGS
jgi:CRP-like cAMP-binding protein